MFISSCKGFWSALEEYHKKQAPVNIQRAVDKTGTYPNGAHLSCFGMISIAVIDLFHFMSGRCQSLIIFWSTFKATGFTSPRTLSDRCVGHSIIQITDQSETFCLADFL